MILILLHLLALVFVPASMSAAPSIFKNHSVLEVLPTTATVTKIVSHEEIAAQTLPPPAIVRDK